MKNTNLSSSPRRMFSIHMPLLSLQETINDSPCKIRCEGHINVSLVFQVQLSEKKKWIDTFLNLCHEVRGNERRPSCSAQETCRVSFYEKGPYFHPHNRAENLHGRAGQNLVEFNLVDKENSMCGPFVIRKKLLISDANIFKLAAAMEMTNLKTNRRALAHND
ncbi:hypothetical protein YC2023_023278 [Brassica napus]